MSLVVLLPLILGMYFVHGKGMRKLYNSIAYQTPTMLRSRVGNKKAMAVLVEVILILAVIVVPLLIIFHGFIFGYMGDLWNNIMGSTNTAIASN